MEADRLDGLYVVYKHYRRPPTISQAREMREPWIPNEVETFCGRHGLAYHYQPGNGNGEPSPRGGYTFCYVYDQDKNLVSMGLAECSPKDSFNYKIGRDISRGRALKTLREIDEVLAGVPPC